MAVKIGNNDITLKLGSADVSAAYIGDTLVYSGGTPPTTYTYYVDITGLDNGDTCYIRWGVVTTLGQNGSNQYTTTADTINIRIIYDDEKYTVDYDYFTLTSNNPDKKVTFTYQGGGLTFIPQGTDMEQYYGRYIKRIVINDTTVPNGETSINQAWVGDSIYFNWGMVFGNGQFQGISSLPINFTPTNPVVLSSFIGLGSTLNPFNDLQIEWAI